MQFSRSVQEYSGSFDEAHYWLETVIPERSGLERSLSGIGSTTLTYRLRPNGPGVARVANNSNHTLSVRKWITNFRTCNTNHDHSHLFLFFIFSFCICITASPSLLHVCQHHHFNHHCYLQLRGCGISWNSGFDECRSVSKTVFYILTPRTVLKKFRSTWQCYCACRWSCTVWCLSICRYGSNHVRILHKCRVDV